jgi:hypothetical protein
VSPFPRTLRIAIGLLLFQAIGILVLAGLVAAGVAQENPADLKGQEVLAPLIFAAVLALTLAALGWQLARRRAWARGPVVALELLFLPAGYYLLADVAWLGAVVIVLALACIGLVIAPASRAALGIR